MKYLTRDILLEIFCDTFYVFTVFIRRIGDSTSLCHLIYLSTYLTKNIQMASLRCSDENLYFVLLQLMSHICKYLPSIDMDLVLLDYKRRKEKRPDVVFTGYCHSRHSHQFLLWGKGWGDGSEPVLSSETNILKQMDTICKDDFSFSFYITLIFYNFL